MRANRRSIGSVLGAAAVLLFAAGILAAPVGLAKPSPGGNNGFVKVDGTDMDARPDNEPHPGCRFVLEFYNYDQGDLKATVTFELQPPTTRPGDDQTILTDTVPIGEDPPGGSHDLDARRTYDLDIRGAPRQPHQGYHVKLTVNADGSRGNDVKHKTFWVDCGPPPSTTTTTTPTPTTTAPSSPTTTVTTGTTSPTAVGPTTTTAPPAVDGVTPTTTSPGPEVLGTTEIRGQETPRAAPDEPALPRTGTDPAFVTFGLVSLVAGTALRGAGRASSR